MAKRQPSTGLRTSARDGQVSAPGGMQNYFLRNIPLWNPPSWGEADYWRRFVDKQSVAMICRDSIANYLNSLDWAIVARDSDKRDELKPKIKHYTKLFEKGNAYYYDLDFTGQIEWFVKDLFTLPFGTASEIGRLDDSPNGRVVWIRPLDAGTLAPTLNADYPIVQVSPGTTYTPTYFPREYISRVYLSPRTEILREGWGFAPPERIWRALEMLSAGDVYYAQLLLNTPEAGILDLGDMAQDAALEWIKSLQDLLFGISPLKMPVLYEHTTDAKFIPFGKPPSEIMYDSVTLKYAAILAAGYGLTLSDIGFPSSSNGGETLAGTIRMERVGKSSGKSIAKKKYEAYANQILPDDLKWTWIDYDDERNVSKGRARLASAQSAAVLIDKKIFTPNEIRQQYLADGLISINVPERIDPNSPEFPQPVLPQTGGGSKGKSLGNPTNPSQGGQGETIPQQIVQRNLAKAEVGIAKAISNANEVLSALLRNASTNLSPAELELWEEYVDSYLTGKSDIEKDQLKDSLDEIRNLTKQSIVSQAWTKDIADAVLEKIIQVTEAVETEKASYRAAQRAEEDFLTGKSDDLTVSPEAVVNTAALFKEDLHGVIFDNLCALLSGYAVLVSKSRMFSDNLEVDGTERVSENIRISREVGKEVANNLSQIIDNVYSIGTHYLSERINQDAGS